MNVIKNELENNLDKFQKCSIIHQTFRRSLKKVTNENVNYIKSILNREKTQENFGIDVVDRLKDEIDNDYHFQSNETSYLFNLLLSLHLYVQYLHSNEN